MKVSIIQACRVGFFIALTFVSGFASQFNIAGPAGSGAFGASVIALTNGNIVVTDPNYDLPGPVVDVGAVYLYDGLTGALISTLTGSTANDRIGLQGVTPLPNGSYVIISAGWDGLASNVGAVTWCSGETGCSGVVTSSNSSVGSTTGASVGSNGITVLTNGNYVVRSDNWNGAATGAGAVTRYDRLLRYCYVFEFAGRITSRR